MVVMKQATGVPPQSLHCHETEPNKCRIKHQYVAIGMVKSGTQTLKVVAEAHPKINTHHQHPESYFFLRNLKIIPNFDKELSTHYLGNLGYLVHNYTVFLDKDSEPNDGLVYGEHSPGYIWGMDNKCYGTHDKLVEVPTLKCEGNSFEPNILGVINRMKKVLPTETLMIATIRDPTKRAYSHFSHFSPMCPEEWYGQVDLVKCFHDMVTREMRDIQICFDTLGFLDARCIMQPYDHESKGVRLVGLGIFAVFFQMWLPHFPNFCILDVSSHGSNGLLGVARDLEQCLGLPAEPDLKIDYEPVSQTAVSASMWDVTKDMLDSFYAPYNRLLCAMAPHTCDWAWVKASFE
jgi:hypothetical protein